MNPGKVSRRDWMIGTASALAVSLLPQVGEAQSSQQPYNSRRAAWMQGRLLLS
jgi:hypothetical protein